MNVVRVQSGGVEESAAVDNDSSKPPVAIVLLFGWMGASIRHVEKYAVLYNRRGCSTVTGVANSSAIMRNDTDALDKFALEAVAHAMELMRGHEHASSIPIIVHVFSNGGAFVLERLECMIASSTTTTSDVAIVGRGLRLGAQVFDSAPAYLHVRAGLKAVTTAAPNVVIRWMIQLLFLLHIVCEAFLSTILLGRPTRPIQFWNRMKDSTAAQRQVYIYSCADELTDAVKLQELIRYRRKKGVEVQSLQLESSKHVQHLRSHPREYIEVIDMMLKCIEKNG